MTASLHCHTERPAAFWVAECAALQYAWGAPQACGSIKLCPEDFEVEEVLGFEPDGAGEHLFLYIEKRGIGTLEAQSLLARHFALAPKNVAFSGMKDKQALTRQWFSLHTGSTRATALATDTEVTTAAAESGLRILLARPNSRKLRRGSHRLNRFRIRIRGLKADREELLARLAAVVEQGAPNYFGPQRFGFGASTLLQALQAPARLISGRQRSARSLQLSAARAFLFNQVLSRRIAASTWNRALPGDVLQLSGTASVFAAARELPAALEQRLASFDVHLTGPLWGRGELQTSDSTAQLERTVAQRYPELVSLLETAGLQQERRALRTQVTGCGADFSGETLMLEFTLGRGSYATSVLRELLQTDTGSNLESERDA